MNVSEGTEVTIGGRLTMVKSRVAKSGRSMGQKWAIVGLQDLEGSIEGMVFSELYADLTSKFDDLLVEERVVLMRGKVDKKRETPCLVVNDIMPIEAAVNKLTTAVVVKLDATIHTAGVIKQVAPVLRGSKGNTPVFAQTPCNGNHKAILKLGSDYWVKASKEMCNELEAVVGNGNVELCGAGTKRKKRATQEVMFKEEESAPQEEELISPSDDE
jgi:DNA polymerase-3 subunit alpha